MSKAEKYRTQLRSLAEWTPYLLKNSGLPGARANLELVEAFADLAGKQQVEAMLGIPAAQAPENSAQVFLVVCGVAALGKLVARGEPEHFARLRALSGDPRWRVREAVAIALQYVGDEDMQRLLQEMREWAAGNWFEKRACAAALAEPRLLKDQAAARQVLTILNRITKAISAAGSPRDESFKVLCQSMGYCWSVAVAASPQNGKPLMEKWIASTNSDIRRIMSENLKKARLERMDRNWVERCKKQLQRSS
ncbi:MAG TPA: HEAT repeat domain-containing protein [Anaerolineales bacterium]